jgi:hypothetical protein
MRNPRTMSCGATARSTRVRSGRPRSPHKHKLSNLTAILDYNEVQSAGTTAEILDLEPLADKWRAFGFGLAEVDGYDVSALPRPLGDMHLAAQELDQPVHGLRAACAEIIDLARSPLSAAARKADATSVTKRKVSALSRRPRTVQGLPASFWRKNTPKTAPYPPKCGTVCKISIGLPKGGLLEKDILADP